MANGRSIGDAYGGLKPKIVEQLPDIGRSRVLYLVPSSETDEDNEYVEYIWSNGRFEQIGKKNNDFVPELITDAEIDTIVEDIFNEQ